MLFGTWWDSRHLCAQEDSEPPNRHAAEVQEETFIVQTCTPIQPLCQMLAKPFYHLWYNMHIISQHARIFSIPLSSASLTHTNAACQLVVKDTFSQDKQNSIQKLQQHQTYIHCISSRFTRPGNLCLLFASDMQAWQVFQIMHVLCSDMHLCALQCWHWRKASPSKTQMMPSVCEHTNFGAHECYGKKTKTLGSFCHILDVFSCTSCYVRDEKRWRDGAW